MTNGPNRIEETITDPTTGNAITFIGTSDDDIDRQIAEHFGVDIDGNPLPPTPS